MGCHDRPVMHILCDNPASAIVIRRRLTPVNVYCWIKAWEKSSFVTESLYVSCVGEFAQNLSAHDNRFTSVTLLCCRHSVEVSVKKVKKEQSIWSHKCCCNVPNTKTHTNVPDCCWYWYWYWFCVRLSPCAFGKKDCNTPSWPEGSDTTGKQNYI